MPEVTCNQWIHSNDVGYTDEGGHLYFIAGKRNTIHVGRVTGRISSLEIESVIESHPDVPEVVVFGVTDVTNNEAIKAIVVPEEGANVRPIDISERCEKQLSHQKLPRYIEIREGLPRFHSGKVRKDVLRDTSSVNVWDLKSGYDLDH